MKALTPSRIWDDLRPRIVALIEERAGVRSTSTASSGGGVTAHDLGGALHLGTLLSAQAPQFLLTDGSRDLTGNLAASSGVTVDGVDISAHAANPDAHHARAHSLISTSDHTASGLAVGNVLQATGASTFTWAALDHTLLAGVLPDQHHAKLHSMLDTAHHNYAGGAALDVFGLSGASTLAKLTPSFDVSGGESALLRSNAGLLTVATLTAATKVRSPLIDTVSGDLTLQPAGVVKLADGKTIQSDNFASGFTGNGWRITEASSVTDAEMDNLTVRGLMRVYELLIHKIRTGNGSYLFANGGKVASVTGGPTYTLNFDEDHGLATNDLLLAQKFTGSGTYQSKLAVTGTPTTKQITATLYSGAAPAAGYEYVRIGNSSDANRRGSVYITADDSGAPFVDVIDGIAAHTDWYSASKIKARLGKLDGMTYAGSSISGYGLYSDNVYLTGRLRAGGGVARADDNGFAVTVKSSQAYDDLNAYTLERADGSTLGGMYGWESGVSAAIDLRATAANAAHTANVGLYASNSLAGTVQAQVAATASDGSAYATLTKGQVALQATMGAANKAITLGYDGLTLPSPVGIGTAHNAAYGLLLSGKQMIAANGRSETYTGLGLEIYTTDNTPPGIGFHRYGYSAVALYEYQEQLWIKQSGGATGKIWHSDNDGVSSGLNADLLDGYHAGSFALLSGATFTGNVKIPPVDGGLEVNSTGGVKIYTNEINVKDNGTLYLGYRNTAYVDIYGSGEHRIGHSGDTYSYHQVVANSRYKIGCWDGSDGAKLLTLNEYGGFVGVACSDPAVELDVNGYSIRVRNNYTPAGAGATGVKGQICYDSSYIYVCTATNTWKRAALSSF